jgi:hypothetical protein
MISGKNAAGLGPAVMMFMRGPILTQEDKIMKITEAEKEFDDALDGGGWQEALALVKNQIAWMDFVQSHELSEGESERVQLHTRRLFVTLRLLTRQLID